MSEPVRPADLGFAGARVHLVGIGGAGMSAIARVLRSMGYDVRGSDIRRSHVITRLESLGIDCRLGHSAQNVADRDVVIYSGAVRPDNVEVEEARRLGLQILKRSDALAALSRLKKTIAVSGTHGKTTTASMLALVLDEAGLNPAFMVGAELNEVGTNSRWTDGEWLVIEADESDGTFLHLSTTIAVVTNIDADHLENWEGSFQKLLDGFQEFVGKAGWAAVLCEDDCYAKAIADQLEGAEGICGPSGAVRPSGTGGDRGDRRPPVVIRYGSVRDPERTSEGTSELYCRLLQAEVSPTGTEVHIEHRDGAISKFRLPLLGAHFALNATAVFAVADLLAIDRAATLAALEAFAGVERRFVYRGSSGGVDVYDDYAHMPAEVAATLTAARELASQRCGRLVAIFQPHLYSRTKRYAREFAAALALADKAFVTDVYAAREDPIAGVSGRSIAALAPEGSEIAYISSLTECLKSVLEQVSERDTVVFMGAGDITSYCDVFLDLLSGRAAGLGRSSKTGGAVSQAVKPGSQGEDAP
jgi:UDP-N-acetylmuramate--alanine ligase